MTKVKKTSGKSTWVDMTAFVDVAFLILSFFMLIAKFKPEESIPLSVPASVSSELIKEKNSLTVLVEKQGRVFVELSPDMRKKVIKEINRRQNLGLDQKEIKNFAELENIGVPFSGIKSLLLMDKEDQKNLELPGIPLNENGGELLVWISIMKSLNAGKKVNWFIKGDSKASYGVFKKVLKALKKNDLNKFLLITDPAEAPAGTALYEKNLEQ